MTASDGARTSEHGFRRAVVVAGACRGAAIARVLEGCGLVPTVSDAGDAGRAALTSVRSQRPAVVVLDLVERSDDAYVLLEELAVVEPGCPVVAVGPAELCAAACSSGAFAAVAAGRGEEDALADAVGRACAIEGLGGRVRALGEHLAAVCSAIGEGVLVFSPGGRILEANAAAGEILGRDAEALRFSSLAGSSFSWVDECGNRLGAADVPAAIALRTGERVEPVLQLIERPDGSRRWIECGATPLRDTGGTGKPYAVLASFRDVTAQRATYDALAGSERRQLLLLEHAAEGHLVLDEAGRVREASSSIGRYWPLEQVIGVEGERLLHPGDRAAVRRLFAAVVREHRGPVREELRVVDGRGGTRWVDVTMTDRLGEPSISGVVLNVREITERKQVEESMAQLSAIVESSSDSIVGLTRDGAISSWNPASEQLYGYAAAEAVGSEVGLLVAPGERDRLAGLLAKVYAGHHVYVPLVDARRSDGSPFELSLSISPVFAADGVLVGASSIGRDISERRQLERERELAEERFRLGFERGAIGMVMFGAEGRIARVNAALCEMLGRSPGELEGHDVEEFVHPEDRLASTEMIAELVGGERDNYRAERRLVRADGEIVWTLVDAAAVRGDGAGSYVFVQLQDITERKRSERALEQQALHDALTGLPNRLALTRRLADAIDRAGTNGSKVAVLFVDVDRFKLVNDGLGHVAGDLLLVELASRLAHGVRAGDAVARFGGDEFVVVCEDVHDDEEAGQLGERILAMFDEALEVGGKPLHLSVSCGIALVDGSTTAEEALRDADAAMYRAKERGRARTERFDEGLRRAVTHRLDTEQELRLALDRDELRVAFQPIVTVRSGRLVGLEALVRWEHPEKGLLLPAEFVPAAEESGLIVPVGERVLEIALRQLVAWRTELPGCEELWVAVNISSRQLGLGDPVRLCARVLADTRAPSHALHLELTESVVMADVESSIRQLEELRALGVTVAVDDFGTGYSSLSYLSRLPVGLLKIDRSFVAGLGAPALAGGAYEIVRAILLLAQGLEVEVCAEGVEEPGQLAVLDALGCGLGQGYLWARPLAPAGVVDWVRSGAGSGAVQDLVRPDVA